VGSSARLRYPNSRPRGRMLDRNYLQVLLFQFLSRLKPVAQLRDRRAFISMPKRICAFRDLRKRGFPPEGVTANCLCARLVHLSRLVTIRAN
jgi:hypothetical protein